MEDLGRLREKEIHRKAATISYKIIKQIQTEKEAINVWANE